QHGGTRGAGVDLLREQPELVFVKDRLLTPRIPVAVHLVRKTDEDAADALGFLAGAEPRQLQASVWSDVAQTHVRFQRDQGDAPLGAHLVQEFRQVAARSGGERKFEELRIDGGAKAQARIEASKTLASAHAEAQVAAFRRFESLQGASRINNRQAYSTGGD